MSARSFVESLSEQRPQLILASTSVYRRALLERLTSHFKQISPDVIEVQMPGEAVEAMALRLALAKANAIASVHQGALVIGSDQAATIDGFEAIGKPGHRAAAMEQLRRASGKTMHFFTALALVRHEETRQGDNRLAAFQRSAVVGTTVKFRELSDSLIQSYLDREPAYDCAGSAKCEGLGIVLMESIQSDDPTALIGLPLMCLSQFLADANYDLFSAHSASDGT